MRVGKVLKKLRTEKKIRQVDLAEHLGTTLQFISNIETGKCSMPFPLMVKASKYMDTNVMLLINAKTYDFKNKMTSSI